MSPVPIVQEAAADDGIPAASALRDIARAKINLTLEVRGRRADGYHELESLVAFTRFGDGLELEPGLPFSLHIDGPFASALEGDNLIARAGALYAETREDSGFGVAGAGRDPDGPGRPPDVAKPARTIGGHRRDAVNGSPPAGTSGAFRLDKRIPVAAGLGGGSADAAAALRLLAGLPADPRRIDGLLPLAARLGADVPACLFSQPAVMTGAGEQLRLLTTFPPIPILLANPRRRLATAVVFRELRAGLLEAANPAPPPHLASIDDVVNYARPRRNDLEAPARRLLPVIGVMLDALAACPGALLARLSGSGPTCFALFRERGEVETAAGQLRDAHPDWWIEVTSLG